MLDRLAAPADAIHAEAVAGVGFQEDVDIHVLTVDASKQIEDASLCRDKPGNTAVVRQNGCELFRRHIIYI